MASRSFPTRFTHLRSDKPCNYGVEDKGHPMLATPRTWMFRPDLPLARALSFLLNFGTLSRRAISMTIDTSMHKFSCWLHRHRPRTLPRRAHCPLPFIHEHICLHSPPTPGTPTTAYASHIPSISLLRRTRALSRGKERCHRSLLQCGACGHIGNEHTVCSFHVTTRYAANRTAPHALFWPENPRE